MAGGDAVLTSRLCILSLPLYSRLSACAAPRQRGRGARAAQAQARGEGKHCWGSSTPGTSRACQDMGRPRPVEQPAPL